MIPSLIQLGLLAAALAAALALFLSVKREMHAQGRQNRARMEEVLRQLQDAQRASFEHAAQRASFEHAAQRVSFESGREAVQLSASPPPRAAFGCGMNLSKRAQAVRLLRRGEDIGHVAAALGVPRREVELLIRVQELSARRAASAGG